MKSKKILINYANDAFKEAQKLNSKTGLEVAGFDRVIEYSPKDIDKKFYKKNKHILDQKRGGGYWLWKPYIILKTLKRKEVKEGDFICYMDSGGYFIDSVLPLICLFESSKQDLLPFGMKKAPLEKYWAKRDAFILMNLDKKKYTDTPQVGCGFVLIKKCSTSIRFFEEFIHYAQDERIITDIPNKLGRDYEGFKENRHDQVIFSLLIKKRGLEVFRHPSQFGNFEINSWREKYPQIIQITRRSNRTLLQKIKYQKACSKGLLEFIMRLGHMVLKKIAFFYNGH